MLVRELLQEIEKLNLPKGDYALDQVMRGMFDTSAYRPYKKIGSAGGYDFLIYQHIIGKLSDLMGIIKRGKEIVGSVVLKKLPSSEAGTHAYVTDAVQVKEAHRGKNLGVELYRKLISYGLILVSSDKQSAGGQAIWKKLLQDKSINVERFNMHDDFHGRKNFSKPVKSLAAMYHSPFNSQFDKRFVAFK